MRSWLRKWVATTAGAALMGIGTFAVTPSIARAGGVQDARAVLTGADSDSMLDVPLGAPSGGPASLVDPIDGTAVGPSNPGNISEYPGASVPLGMVQFSPDTSPNRQVTTGSGYDYADRNISGFSLTHLSGDGCAIYGDIPILPVIGTVPSDPDETVQPFSHTHEQASAGSYSVSLGRGAPDQDIGIQLTATTRSALGAFTFPAQGSGQYSDRIAGKNVASDYLLFKVSDSADGSTASKVRIVGNDELEGSVTSGDFCGIPGSYTLYFAAKFSQTFDAGGTWKNDVVGSAGSCDGTVKASCGAWVRFAHRGRQTQRILAKVGVSFVSVTGAAANLKAEDPGWNFQKVSGTATATWNGLLGRIAVSGGTLAHRRTFYTAMYHSLLFPSVFSDDDGRYIGFDHKVHTLGKGQAQYSNFSECDVYRTEVPLLAALLPAATSQMMQSLLRDAAQTKGDYLPKWVIAGNDAGEWDGDSVDPVIADAYAYGARQFNVKDALSLMVRGATVPASGLITERPNLQEYEVQGWVPQLTYDITSYPYTDGGSETLEYALDDFSISQLARAVGETSTAAIYEKRGQNWQNLFDPSTGYLAARTADGSFPPGPAFQPASAADQSQGIAQEGFEEGNAVQYTWAVPQNLAGLFGLMGGDAAAVSKLSTFFTRLNATRYKPYDWAGNEPSMSVPYDFDYAGEPWRSQAVVRQIMTGLYHSAPVNEPGEDDLGALSSWYVWSALGLYPETPGVADLAMTSPLFPKVRLHEGDGHSVTVIGSHAPDTFIESAKLAIGSGHTKTWNKPWISGAALTKGATLSVGLGLRPDKAWGAADADAPPSFSMGASPAVPFSTPGGLVTVPAHGVATFQLGVEEESVIESAQPVSWHLVAAPGTTGVATTPDSGTIRVTGRRGSTTLQITAQGPGDFPLTFDLRQGDASLPNLTLDVHVGP
jgi:predicted alpha-1,2-mannosidase